MYNNYDLKLAGLQTFIKSHLWLVILFISLSPGLGSVPGEIEKPIAYNQCPPVFQNIPPAITVQCDQVPAIPGNVTATSCCDIISLTVQENKNIGTICQDDFTLTRIWTATDDCGNTATASQVIKVIDTTPPFFINPPGNITVECDNIPTIPVINTGDNCDNDVFSLLIETKNPGACFGTFNLTRLWVIRDNCDNANTHVQVVTIKDTNPPVFTKIPPNLTISCNDPVPPAVPGVHVTAEDACNPSVLITQSEITTPGVCPIFYVLTRTFSANDGCGNIATATQTITVLDNTPPVIGNVPADMTITCNAPPPANPVATDNCDPNVDLTVSDVILSGGGCGEDVVMLRTWTATDACGNSSTASQTVTVKIMGDIIFNQDPPDITASCSNIPDAENVTANDFCGLPLAVSLDETTLSGSCDQSYTLIRTWTATDPCGNSATQQQIVSVSDVGAPIISGMPMDITVDCEDIPDPMMVSASDACDPNPSLNFAESITGDICQARVITRVWLAEDHCGNTAQIIQKITVLDDEPPVIINPPADLTISCGDALPPVPTISVTDDCGSGNVNIDYQEFSNGGPCGPQMIGRVWTVTDDCGNTAYHAQMITILDNEPPIITPPADVTVNCDEVPDLEDPIIEDDCDDNPLVTYTEMVTQGQCPIVYTLMRTWKVTDQCGNMATATQNVVVIDTEPPVLEFIHPLLVGLMDGDTFKIACDKPVIFDLDDVTVTDNCDPDPMIWMEEDLIMTGPCKIFMLCTFMAKDACGNIGSLSFYYLIGDDEPPVLHGVPDDLTLECDEPVPPPAVVWATDNCSDSIQVTFSQVIIPGACPEEYMIIRTWTAEDECGNSVIQSQKITILDTQPPVWMPMHPIFNGLSSGDTLHFECDGVVILDEDDLIAKDNCDLDVDVIFTEDITQGDCETDGYILKMICTWYATDNCGNDTSFVLVVIVSDTTPPVFSLLKKDITINCDDQIPAPIQITAEDNCDGPVPIFMESIVIPGNCPQAYIIETLCWAEDACGNRAEQTQRIYVVDNEAPVFVSFPDNLTLECTDSLVVVDHPTVTDNCSTNITVTFEEKQGTGNCDGAYLILREWTATDECGNSTTKVQIISVDDDTPPVLIGVPGNVTVECDDIPEIAVVTADDVCDPDVQVFSNEAFVPGNCPGNFTLIRTWSATDDCGNVASATQTITVRDTQPPVFGNIPTNITIECDDTVIPPGNPTVTDNCDLQPQVTVNTVVIPGSCPHDYTVIYTWTATDHCGNSSTASQSISVIDTKPPVFVNVPSTLELECDQVIPTFEPEVVDDCDPQPTITFTETNLPGPCAHTYTLVRIWTATDACGNSSTAQQIIKVSDTTPPVIMTLHPGLNGVNSGDTLIFECDNVTIFDIDDVKATDNCDPDPTITFDEVVIEGDCIQDGYFLKMLCTWTATDDCGNSSSFHIVVIIVDNTPPVIKGVPANITLECDEPLPSVSGVFAEDNCSENVTLTFSEQTQIGLCKYNYIVTRTWTATDECGNTATAQQKITVEDTTPPVLVGVPDNITLECDQPLPNPANVTATDNCDPDPEVEYKEARQDGNCPQEYILLRIWTATDDCGNTSVKTQIITVVDTKAPVLIGVPGNVTVECNTVPTPPNVTAIDNCDLNVQVLFSELRVNGNCPYNYTLIRTWSAEDDCGNTVSASQTITVRDTKAPILVGIPGHVTIECDQPVPTPPFVTATDNCDSNPVVTLSTNTIPGNCPQSYIIIRTWTATDNCGNSSTASQSITVRDTQPPVFTNVPGTLELECDQVIPNAQPDVQDNCDPQPTVTLVETTIPGACDQEYTLIRIWTATDACGNSSTAQQIIKVTDTTPPVIMTLHPGLNGVMSGDTLIFECDNVTIFDIDDVKATDNCDPDPTITFDEVVTEGDCIQDGYLLKMHCTWTATDDCGNSSSFYIVVFIVDNTPPVIKGVPANVTLECDEPLPSTAGVFAEDNCTDNVTLTLSEQTQIGLCKYNYIVTRTWTATDDCGNTATAQQKITVEDTTPPVLVGVPDNITLECDQPLPNPANVTATDNCDPDPEVEYKEARQDGNCPQEYILLRIWTATDDCGNTSVKTQIITVVDTKAPVLIGVPSNVTVECNTVPTPPNVTAIDNCDLNVQVAYNELRVNGNCPGNYTLIRTWSAEDDCGNPVSASQTITVRDTKAPILVGIPGNVTIECDQPVPTPPFVTATDNCDSNPVVTLSTNTIPGNCPQSYIIIRTWTATDNCGNSSTASQSITVRDTQPPVFTNVPGTLELECDQVIPNAQPDVQDNCDPQPTVTLAETTIPGACEQEYTLIRIWTATDACGNSSTAQQIIKVTDTTPPVIMTLHPGLNGVMSGDTLIFECDNVTIFDIDDVKATDNCDPDPTITFDEVVTEGDCIQDGYLLKMHCTWTATDDCGNSSSFYIVVFIVDNTPPVIKGVPANVTLECDEPLPSTAGVFAEDNCTDNVTLTLSEQTQIGLCKYNYILTRTWTATDECGNTATAQQKITVEDTTPPVLVGVPANITIECDQPLPNPGNVTAIDNCDPDPEVSYKETRQDGNCPQEYILLRIWTAEDDCGNSSIATQIITVVDDEAPILIGVPADVTVECDDVPAPADVKAVDNCDPNVLVVYNELRLNGNCPHNYTLIRTWRAEDDCGNEVSDSQTITVRDTEAPIFTKLPVDLTLACDVPWPPVDYEAVDNCSQVLSVSIEIEGGEPCDSIADRRIIRVTDECGNTAEAIQNIYLIDTVPPFFKPFDAKLFVPCDEIAEWPELEAMDNCDEDVEITFTDITTPGSCPQEYTILRTWTATDDCGNTTTAIQLLAVIDDEAPVLIPLDSILIGVPSGSTLTFECDEAPALNEDAFTATDNCDPDPEITFDETILQGDCLLDGYYLKMICTWTATDDCGNQSSYTITVLITDSEAPVFTFVPANITIQCDDALPTTEAIAEDACSDVDVTFEDVQTSLNCGYLVTRIWTATDACDNSVTAIQVITVSDTEAPFFTTVVNNVTINLDLGDTIPPVPVVEADDDCSDVVVSLDVQETPGIGCGYLVIRTWTATDACGNTALLTQIITVLQACPCVLPEVEEVVLVHPDCGENNGSITVITVEDPAGFDFIWVPALGQPNADGNSRTQLGAGQYTIVIQDPTAINCFTKLTVTLEDSGSCIDTVYVTIPMDDPYTLCIDQVLDFNGPIGDVSICGQDPQVSISVTDGSACVVLDPVDGFVGTATLCVVHCNVDNPPVCDTTYIVVTINAVAPPCDPYFNNSAYQLEAPACDKQAKACLQFPHADVKSYEILVNGSPYPGITNPCGSGTAIYLSPGSHIVEITHLSTLCFDTKTIQVSCPDSVALLAVDDTAKTRKNKPITIAVLLNDIIPPGQSVESFLITANPSFGSLQVTADLKVIYTPRKDYCGQDFFVYEICTEQEVCDDAMVVIDVDCSGLVVHTGFSPNGDMVNDKFTVDGIEDYPNNEVSIFNRWGNQVFYQKGYKNNWDGSWNEGVLPDGTYYYFLKDGEGETYFGFVQIQR